MDYSKFEGYTPKMQRFIVTGTLWEKTYPQMGLMGTEVIKASDVDAALLALAKSADALREELAINAKLLAKQTDLARQAETERDECKRSADERVAAAVAEERKRIVDKLDRWGQEAHDTGMLPEAATLRDAAAQLRFESAR